MRLLGCGKKSGFAKETGTREGCLLQLTVYGTFNSPLNLGGHVVKPAAQAERHNTQREFDARIGAMTIDDLRNIRTRETNAVRKFVLTDASEPDNRPDVRRCHQQVALRGGLSRAGRNFDRDQSVKFHSGFPDGSLTLAGVGRYKEPTSNPAKSEKPSGRESSGLFWPSPTSSHWRKMVIDFIGCATARRTFYFLRATESALPLQSDGRFTFGHFPTQERRLPLLARPPPWSVLYSLAIGFCRTFQQKKKPRSVCTTCGCD